MTDVTIAVFALGVALGYVVIQHILAARTERALDRLHQALHEVAKGKAKVGVADDDNDIIIRRI